MVVILMLNPPAKGDDEFIYVKDSLETFTSLGIKLSDIALVHYYGGGYLNKYWGDTKLWLVDYLLDNLFDPGKIIFTGQGIGDFDKKMENRIAKVTKSVRFFSTRDGNYPKINHAKVLFDDATLIADIKVGAAKRKNTVAVNIRCDDFVGDEDYVGMKDSEASKIIRDVDTYSRRNGHKQVYFPMIQGRDYDELASIEKKLSSLGVRAKTTSRPKDMKELMRILESCSVLVTTSYHAAIASLYCGTPVVALTGSPYYTLKFKGLRERVVNSDLIQVLKVSEFDTKYLDELIKNYSSGTAVKTRNRITVLYEGVKQSRSIIDKLLSGSTLPRRVGVMGGCGVSTLNNPDLSRQLGCQLRGDERTFIAKANTDFVRRTAVEKKFRDVLSTADLVIPDGRGVQWAARYLTLPITSSKFFCPVQAVWQMVYSGAAIVFNPKFLSYPIPEVFPGVEALEMMLAVAEKADASVFFFGSTQATLEKAVENIKKRFPKLQISGYLNGYDFQKDSRIDPVKTINGTDAKLLIVALGSPKQEYWIHDNLSKLKNVRVAVGEGGTLDRIANPSQKAPRWINRIGLEWLWRLLYNKSLTDSRNRFQRFWNSVPVFIYQVVKYKIHNGTSETRWNQ